MDPEEDEVAPTASVELEVRQEDQLEPAALDPALSSEGEGEIGMAERVGETLEGYVDDPSSMLGAPIVHAIFWVVGAFLVARVLDFVVSKVFKRLTRKTETLLDDRLLDHLHGPVVKSVVLIGLWFAAHGLDLSPGALGFTRSALQTVAIFVWSVFAVRAGSLMLRAASRTDRRFRVVQARTLPLFDNVARMLIFLVSSYVLIQAWGWNVTGWAASAGIVGIAVGFAAQDTLSNLIAGVLILIDAPYRVGDYIILRAASAARSSTSACARQDC